MGTNEVALSQVFEGRVMSVDTKSWTCEVRSNLSGKVFSNIQVLAPYLNFENGNGVYVMPEVGAIAKVLLPGDTTAPFVLGYISPPFLQGDQVQPSEEGDYGAVSAQAEGYADLSGNRPKSVQKDITLKCDTGFVRLHSGGTLQLGANELAQRIYIPISNMIMDFSERYESHNIGGSICWGLRAGQYEQRESEWCQTFRVYADDLYADVRIVCGGIHKPVPLPNNDWDVGDVSALEIGKTPMVYEVTVVPGGFKAASGALSSSSVHEGLKLVFRFDRSGNAHIKAHNFLFSMMGRLKIKAKEKIEIESLDTITMSAKNGATLGSEAETKIAGKTVKIAQGSLGVARVGDPICIPLPPPLAALLPPGVPAALFGSVMAGSGKVMAG